MQYVDQRSLWASVVSWTKVGNGVKCHLILFENLIICGCEHGWRYLDKIVQFELEIVTRNGMNTNGDDTYHPKVLGGAGGILGESMGSHFL